MSGVLGMKHKNKGQPYKKQELEGMCQDYLRDNFHKFSEANKQKIALTICSKMVKQTLETRNEVDYSIVTPDQSKHLQNQVNKMFDRALKNEN